MGVDSNSAKPSRISLVILYCFDVLFLLSMLVLPLAWFWNPYRASCGPMQLTVSWGLKPLVAPFVFLFLRLFAKRFVVEVEPDRKGLLEFPVLRKASLLLMSLYFTVGLLELCLAVVGFERDMAPVIFSLKDEAGNVEEQKGYADPELLFKFRKGEVYHGIPINSLGFRDREVVAIKPEGMMRVICMGDSCTAQGKPSYSGYLHEKLTVAPLSNQPWEAFNMAVYGYTSLQGLRVFQKQGKDLQPDVVTLYFGWNDHWLNLQSDRARMAVSMTKRQARYYSRLKNKRVFMLYKQLVKPDQRFNKTRTKAGPRVPHEEYRAVLSEFVAEIRAAGAAPLLITAPRRDAENHTLHDEYPDVEIDFNAVHDDYVNITREVGAALDVDVLDLYALFADEEYDSFFTHDGIHLTQKGLGRIADELYAEIDRMRIAGRIKSAE